MTYQKLSEEAANAKMRKSDCALCVRHHVPNETTRKALASGSEDDLAFASAADAFAYLNKETPDLIAVSALDDFKLAVEFADGKKGVFDCSSYLKFEFMERLRDSLNFNEAFVDHGTVAWPKGEDLCPDDVYENLITRKEGAVM